MSPVQNEMKTLTAFRFFAAAWVLWLHFALMSATPDTAGPLAARYGSAGVTFFFMLSGFILTVVYRERLREMNLREMWNLGARLARIWPVHALTFAITLFVTREGLLLLQLKFGAAFWHSWDI